MAFLGHVSSISIAKTRFLDGFIGQKSKFSGLRPAGVKVSSGSGTNKGGILMRGGILKWNTPDGIAGFIQKNKWRHCQPPLADVWVGATNYVRFHSSRIIQRDPLGRG